jgi:DNA replication and repair protein RecF
MELSGRICFVKLTRITLKNYRNIAQMELSPCDTVNVIYGDNGQGKTNLLESIYLLTGNPSFRGAKLSEVIRFSQKQSQITALFSDQEREQKLSIKLGAKKEILLNQVPLKKYSELAGQFYCVVFSPEDLDFVKGSPKNRRRFLDSAICQITPQYMGYLEQYDHVLEQRNALLKELNRSPYWKDTLDIWDLQLAKLGTILSIYRKDYLAKLGRVSSVIYDGLSSQRERFSLRYLSSGFDSMEEITSYEDEIIKDYLQKLQSFLEQDIRCGFTNVGIHRDDIDLLVNDLPAKTYGSQGQQRSCILALKLAEASLLYRVTGEKPVILLDDVMSELDAGRQEYVLNHVKDQQVFITCCDVIHTIRLKEGKIFRVGGGSLMEEKAFSQAE